MGTICFNPCTILGKAMFRWAGDGRGGLHGLWLLVGHGTNPSGTLAVCHTLLPAVAKSWCPIDMVASVTVCL